MSATFNSSLANTRDYMRLALSDTDGLTSVSVAFWSAVTTYAAGTTVQFGLNYFQALQASTNQSPVGGSGAAQSTAYWAQVNGPILADETYDALLAQFPYAEALAQATMAVIDYYVKDPVKYDAGLPNAKYDWSDRLTGLKQLLEDCQKNLVQAPGGPSRTGTATAPSTALFPPIANPPIYPGAPMYYNGILGFRP